MRPHTATALLAVVWAGCDSASAWREYRDPKGRFRVEVPGEFHDVSDDVGRPAGGGPRTALLLRGRGLTYGLEFEEGLLGVWVPAPAALLDDFRAGLARRGNVLGEASLKLDGRHPGREVRVELKTGGVLRTRLYLVGRRAYRLSVVGPGDTTGSADADRFFGSFKVLTP
jgi:hypothetical protein